MDQNVDVIVNAAHADLRGGGGIDGAIHVAAGSEMMDFLVANYPAPLEPGKVGISPGFKLKQSRVLHAPGPMWKGGHKGESEHLRATYKNCLVMADLMGAESLGFCSIATGIYHFPLEQAASIAITEALNFKAENLEHIVFAMFKAEEYDTFKDVYARLSKHV